MLSSCRNQSEESRKAQTCAIFPTIPILLTVRRCLMKTATNASV